MLRWTLAALAALIVGAILTRFLAKRTFGRAGAVHRLSPPGWLVWGAVFATIGVTGAVFLAGQVPMGLARAAAFAGLVLYLAVTAGLCWYAFLAYYAWTAEGFGAWDPWRRHRLIRWAELVEAGSGPFPFHAYVRDARRRIVYPRFLDGEAELSAFIARRLSDRARP